MFYKYQLFCNFIFGNFFRFIKNILLSTSESQSFSVINGITGWSSFNVWTKTHPETFIASSDFSESLKSDLINSIYQSQYVCHVNWYNKLAISWNWYFSILSKYLFWISSNSFNIHLLVSNLIFSISIVSIKETLFTFKKFGI